MLYLNYFILFLYNMFMNLRIFILHFTIFVSILSSDTINIFSTKEPLNILKQTDVYIDKENKHDFKYILKNNNKLFKPNKENFLHLGYSPDAIWLKFSIKNSTNSEIKKVLEISNQMLDDIFLYTKQTNGKYIEEKNGVLHRKTFDENILKLYFNISIEAGETKEFFLKVSSLSCAVYFELNMMTKDQLYKKEINHQLILALFFGSIITLIIYNLFIYYFTKDLAYLYYVLYLFFTILERLSYTALTLYIYPESFWETDIFLTIFYISFIFIFSLLFIREFLNIKRYKKIDYIFKMFLALNIIFIIFTSPEFYPIDAVLLILLLSMIYMICISFYLLYKGEQNAKYMILGWSIVMFGWIMIVAYNYGVWSIVYDYPYFFEITIFIEAILFSIALANRLNTTKELEKSIATNKILTRELHHRVKNNMQFIISMYRLKLAKYSNKDISNSLKEVEGTIQAMSATHEMLYAKNTVVNIDTKEYITTLIDRLKNSYDSSNINIKLNIATDIDIDNSIYVGIILNELITNSFKYAFKNNKGQITISLSKHNKIYELIVKDDGIGFNATKENETFGIELVKTLIKDELDGKVKINTARGYKYIINWI